MLLYMVALVAATVFHYLVIAGLDTQGKIVH